MSRAAIPASLLALALALGGGCGTARRGEPLQPPRKLDERQARGQQVFFRRCSPCHPQGQGGLGPALHNKRLPGFVIRFQVRRGLGAMPAFSAQELSAADLDALVAWMRRMQPRR